jgi:hypothetical protein
VGTLSFSLFQTPTAMFFNLLPEITPRNEGDLLARLFNLYIDKLDTLVAIAEPNETMQEYIFQSIGGVRSEKTRRTYEVLLLGKSLRDIHYSAFQALELLEEARTEYKWDLKGFAVQRRLDNLDCAPEEYEFDDSDFEEDGLNEEGEPAWKVVFKDDEESLRQHTLREELSLYMIGSRLHGEALGTSGADAFADFTRIVRSKTDLSFRKFWKEATGHEIPLSRMKEDGSFEPVSIAEQIEEEINEDVKNNALADTFEQVITAFRHIAALYSGAEEVKDYQAMHRCLTVMLYGPEAAACIDTEA